MRIVDMEVIGKDPRAKVQFTSSRIEEASFVVLHNLMWRKQTKLVLLGDNFLIIPES